MMLGRDQTEPTLTTQQPTGGTRQEERKGLKQRSDFFFFQEAVNQNEIWTWREGASTPRTSSGIHGLVTATHCFRALVMRR